MGITTVSSTMSTGEASCLDSPTQGIPSSIQAQVIAMGWCSIQWRKKNLTTKPDKRKTTKTGTEKLPPTEPVHMTGNGERPTREAINLNRGRKTRYNTIETRSMNITETKLKIGNWNGQGLSSPVNINIPIDECEQFQLDIIALTELHWPGRGRTKHKNLEFIHSGSDNCRREMVARFNCRHTKLTTPYTVICDASTNSETCPDDVTNRNAV